MKEYLTEKDKEDFQQRLLALFEEYNASIDIEFWNYSVDGISINIKGEFSHYWSAFRFRHDPVDYDDIKSYIEKQKEEDEE